ncbi:right-handed parallel beta-helix repeat-containing protein [Cyclobacterium jeungdonense]|uniref:Right-handed parallel beta-helix repeat-containing protein n=1 Tax=Cyclobacterium jeungdonense TaxID=708087 RepID=A0ABT8C102_9BACT|nr:right-handed parallel beta-helix repeat-containing protein [Cyclobacterium jeungdonense]MDN3686381.1 right-handed parallel beta-helix repeat-containing protein [Cyclobacterium jeungdonense]
MSKDISEFGRWLKPGFTMAVFTFSAAMLFGQSPTLPSDPNVIPIDGPGYYGREGSTYVLTRDIRAEKSALFLGKDLTLDLNGHTITFADGAYDSLENGGFESGLDGWDLSKAPGAELLETSKTRPFVGEKLLGLQKGDEILSPYIDLPYANRSYYAICGITGRVFRDMGGDLSNEMKISLFVEDERGEVIEVMTDYGSGPVRSSPVFQKSPRLGGGFIVAHIQGLPAGKYRIRVKADTDCLVDEIGIFPAFDVGIGIVGKTHPKGHYDHLYENQHAAFYDYTADFQTGNPLPEIPQVSGKGTVTIKNGTIKSGFGGVMSWGIQSTADDVELILDGVTIINQGINATAVDVPQARISHCRFEVANPQLIHRHGSQHYAVDLRGKGVSEVAYSAFYGGQGCLVFKGKKSSIHHNTFVNHQLVTNHYSIMAMGDSSLIYENTIVPEVGSGIEIFRHKGIEIFNNRIKIEASPPTTEYGKEEFSTAAIRIADYRDSPGSPTGAFGNKVYNNTIEVRGRSFPEYPEYTPMAWALFYSASAGDNFVFGNRITVDHPNPSSGSEAAAFYIGGGLTGFGGVFQGNTVYTNVPAAWIGCRYGGAVNTRLAYNHFINTSSVELQPFRMGWESCDSCYAKEVTFVGNTFHKMDFGFLKTEQPHSYRVMMPVEVLWQGNKMDMPVIRVEDKSGTHIQTAQFNKEGLWQVELLLETYQHPQSNRKEGYWLLVGKEKRFVTRESFQPIVFGAEE